MALPGARGQAKRPDLATLNIEDLMNIEVTSVAKKAEKLSETASAIFVITQDDIRGSGVTNIPDLLRMVPGVDVAQINADTWAPGSQRNCASIDLRVPRILTSRDPGR